MSIALVLLISAVATLVVFSVTFEDMLYAANLSPRHVIPAQVLYLLLVGAIVTAGASLSVLFAGESVLVGALWLLTFGVGAVVILAVLFTVLSMVGDMREEEIMTGWNDGMDVFPQDAFPMSDWGGTQDAWPMSDFEQDAFPMSEWGGTQAAFALANPENIKRTIIVRERRA